MELRALLHLCNNPKCKDEPGSEADARREGNEVIVQCRTCPNHGEYSVDLFDDESFDPIHEALAGQFTVTYRFIPPGQTT